MPSADNSDTSAATAGSATLGDENGNDSHIRADRRAWRTGRQLRRSHRETVGASRSLNDAVTDETVERLPHPARVESRRTSECSRPRRSPGPKNIDDAAADLAHRPDERSLTLHAPVDRPAGGMRAT